MSRHNNGPPLVFGRLWERQGLPEILGRLSRGRSFGFAVERVVFALALQRLIRPGSDLQGSLWVKDIELQHLYRCVGFLNEVHQELERELYMRDRDLFNQALDLVFIDTTSTYGYGSTPGRPSWRSLRRRSRAREPKASSATGDMPGL